MQGCRQLLSQHRNVLCCIPNTANCYSQDPYVVFLAICKERICVSNSVCTHFFSIVCSIARYNTLEAFGVFSSWCHADLAHPAGEIPASLGHLRNLYLVALASTTSSSFGTAGMFRFAIAMNLFNLGGPGPDESLDYWRARVREQPHATTGHWQEKAPATLSPEPSFPLEGGGNAVTPGRPPAIEKVRGLLGDGCMWFMPLCVVQLNRLILFSHPVLCPPDHRLYTFFLFCAPAHLHFPDLNFRDRPRHRPS